MDTKVLAYQRRMQRVCDFIDTHLDENLSVDQLCSVAYFSKFHFHRQFAGYMGMNVAKYVHLMRMKRASYQLVFDSHLSITEIAYAAQYENSESFSRAFKRRFRQTPSHFRKSPNWAQWHQQVDIKNQQEGKKVNVEIEYIEQSPIAVLEHKGPAELLNQSVAHFIEWRKESGLSPVGSSQTFGMAYSDPKTTAPEEFRFDICGSVAGDVPPNDQGVIMKEIPASRCAKVRHLGSRDQMDPVIYQMYQQWLPSSGESLRDFPLLMHYINLFPQVDEHELITDIYLLLED